MNRATPLEESKNATKPRAYNQSDRICGFYRSEDGHLAMGEKEVEVDGDNLYVEDKMYQFRPGLMAFITHRHPQREEYDDDDDYTAYRALVAQTNVRSSTHLAGARNPYRTWKWKYMLEKMFTPMESLPEEET